MRKAPSIVAMLCALFAGQLSACGPSADATLGVIVIGVPEMAFRSGPRLTPPAQLVRGASVEGLVGFDENGEVAPGLADRWIVTDDGQSYIFRLRDGTWSDGSPLTGQSARSALREAIAALRGTSLGLDLAGIEEIRVMTGRVIELRLAYPMPDLLQLLAQPELGLMRDGRGTGPMRVARQREGAVLRPIPPEQRGLPAVEGWSRQVRSMRLTVLPAREAVERFKAGDADVLLGGAIETFPYARSVGLLRGTIQLDPVTGLLGLAVQTGEGFLSDPANREAVAMAIDREALIAALGVAGWQATTRIVAPGLRDDTGQIGERWPGLDIDERRTQASARVARWRQTHGGGAAPRLRIALPEGPGTTLLFGRLAGDLKQVGIEAQRVPENADAELRMIDAVARYPRAPWFLNQLSCQAQRGLCSADADKLMRQADHTADPGARAALLADAEAELTKANVFIPFGAPIRWSLVRGDATGFAVNRWGVHPLMPMAQRPK